MSAARSSPAAIGAPSERILDLFAVPGPGVALPGGQGASVRAGDLVLSPGRDAATAGWLNPILARLAVTLDERPDRRPRDLRVAMPVPARDGSWVVDGWGASRFEPGTTTCRDLDVTLAAGRLLHAELASVVGRRPAGLDERGDPWARAEALAFGPIERLLAAAGPTSGGEPVRRVAVALRALESEPESESVPGSEMRQLGVNQLVHADLAGNVLLDAAGAPVVIDFSPAWRPVLWAEAVCVLDAVLWQGAPRSALARFAAGRERQAMLRAVAWRALVDVFRHADQHGAFRPVLDVVAPG